MTNSELKKALKSGEIITLTNNEEYLEAEVSYKKTRWGGCEYKIFFNGAFVKITKTFEPIIKKLDELVKKYNLTLQS